MKASYQLILIIGITFIFSDFCFAAKRPTVYVAAPSGISLREGPTKRAAKIETLPYGTKISNYNYTENWDTIDGYGGTWLRVAVNGKDGYIFGGYTIPITPPKSNTKNLLDYLSEVYGTKKSSDTLLTGDETPVIYHKFKSNILLQECSQEYSQEFAILNLNLSVQQAYLLFYLLERNVTGIWDEYYHKETAGLPESCPVEGYKKDDVFVTRRDRDIFEITIKYYQVKIFRVQTNVIITWTIMA